MDRSGKAFSLAWVRRTVCVCARQQWNGMSQEVWAIWRAQILLLETNGAPLRDTGL